MVRNFEALDAEEQEDVVGLYYNLFAGNLSTYAIRFELGDGVMYVPSSYDGQSQFTKERVAKVVKDIGTPEFGPEAVRAHLEGRHLLGVYPITSDSTVRWFALDFDGKTGDPWTEAVEQALVLHEEAQIPVYLERSQSGNGYHIWGFLDGEINAGRLRHALSPYISKTDTYDRMFPNQAGVTETRPLGNLIALPLHGGRLEKGNSAFVRRGRDGSPELVTDQYQFLESIQLCSVERMEELFEEAGEFQPEREHTQYEGEAEGLGDSFKLIHPKYGCEFIKWAWDNPEGLTEPLWYAVACNFAQLEDGRELFHQMSQRDTLRYDARQVDKKYDQALAANKPHSCEVIRGLGGECSCDQRFPGKVFHPFDLVRLPFKQLVESVGVDGDVSNLIMTADTGFDMVLARLAEIEKDPEAGQGYKYGISTLDKVTRLRDSDLVIVAARPGMGKTGMAGTAIDNGAMEGVPQFFFSAEMANMQVFTRQIAIRSGVSLTRMATGQLTKSDWEKLRAARDFVSDRDKYPVFVDDTSRSTERIFEVAARLTHKYGKGVLWVDYLQLLQKLPRESMFDAVTRITSDLKMLAKALNCPVVALTQLNRTADDATSDSQTFDSWLRGSGEVEQSADVIIFILGEKGPGIRERIFALHKERHRESGMKIPLEFNQSIMRFADAGTFGISPGKIETKRRSAPAVNKTDAPEMSLEEQQRQSKQDIADYVRQRDEQQRYAAAAVEDL